MMLTDEEKGMVCVLKYQLTGAIQTFDDFENKLFPWEQFQYHGQAPKKILKGLIAMLEAYEEKTG